MSPKDWTEMTAAYVLGSLDPEEQASFEERLASDAELERDVASYREVMGGLAGAAPSHEPPAALKERIVVEARGSEASSPRADLEPSEGSGEQGSTGQGTEGREAPGRETPGRGTSGRGTTLPWLLAAAGVILSLGLGVAYQRMRTDSASLQVAYDQAQADNAALRIAFEQVASDLEARETLLATFLGPDVRTATLAATGEPPSARLFWNTIDGSVVMAAFDLPPAATGRTYQLWGIATGLDPVSFGTFQTEPDGTAIFRNPVPEGIEYELGAVTEEPAGGSPQPTSTPFLIGDLSSGF